MDKIIANNADDLYELLKEELIRNGEDTGTTVELVNVNLVLTDPTKNTMLNCSRKMSLRYALGELLWYSSLNRSAKAINNFSKFWLKLADDEGNVNSNYGWCIHKKYDFDQYEMVKQLLINDPTTRQAVIHIKEARNLIVNPTKDVNCTISLQFLLRNNKLNLITTMRSNDLKLGLPYDVFSFTCLQIKLAMELGVEIGTYYHNVGSLHCYHKDMEALLK